MTLDSLLAEIEQSQLVRRSLEPDPTYLFKHALVQEAAYASLLKQDRKRLHHLVGEALERRCADRLEEIAPQLAYHFDEASDDDRALKYFTLAGDAAARVYALVEASQHYSHALDLARRMNVSTPLKELYLKRGQALHSSGLYDAAWANYVEMMAAARTRGDPAMELAGLLESATMRAVFSPIFDPVLARTLCEQALALAETIGDREVEARVLWILMRVTVNVGGEPRQALAYGERALSLARELHLREQLAFCLNDIQYAYSYAGYPGRALEVLGEARALWRALGNMHMLADNLDMTALITAQAGSLEEALKFADEARRLSQDTDNQAHQVLSRFVIGLAQLECGRPWEAIQALDEALAIDGAFGSAPINTVYALTLRALGDIPRGLAQARAAYDEVKTSMMNSIFGPGTLGVLAELLIDQAQLTEAQTLIERAYSLLELGRGASTTVGLFAVVFAEAELELARENPSGAIAVIDRFISSLHDLEARLPFPTLYVKGRALQALGQTDEARAVLARARREAEGAGSRMTLWRVLVALSQIESDPIEAAALRQQARALIEYIADHCGPDLRKTFLDQASVRSMLRDDLTT